MHMNSEVCGIKFRYQSGKLFITLPSGMRYFCVKPKFCTNQFGGERITYENICGTKKWERLETYGPKLVENIVQATSRSPYTEDIENNTAASREYRRFAVEAGYIPIAPHLLFTQFLDDHNPKERELGSFFGNAILSSRNVGVLETEYPME